MNENEKSSLEPLNLEVVRTKLQLVVSQWSERLPDVISENRSKLDMKSQMAINMFLPFLPKLQDSLKTSLDSLPDEQLLGMIDKVEEFLEWLLQDN